MRAARCDTLGGPVTVGEVPPPEGEVLVDVRHAAVNFTDMLIVEGRYQIRAEPPFTPGSEFAGVVAESAHGFEKGERVFGSVFVGAFAEQVAARATALARIPEGTSSESAAAFGVGHFTAYSALRLVAAVRPGERVAVLGAAGGVGLAAVELAALLGAEVIAVASSPAKRAACAEQGAAVTLPYEGLKEGLRAAGGADVVLDPVGGPHAEEALRAMRWGGRFVTLGYAAGDIPRIPLNLALLKGVAIHGFNLGGWAQHAPGRLAEARAELHALFNEGRIHPHIHAVHPLTDVTAALAVGRDAIGKVLLQI